MPHSEQLVEILRLRDNVLQRLESQRRSAVALAAIKELAAARAAQASSQSDLGDRHPQVGDAGPAAKNRCPQGYDVRAYDIRE